MRIVVTTRNAEPIDLTASIIKAKDCLNNGLPCSVEWIVENTASISDFENLNRIASIFKEIDICVFWQKDIPILNPNKIAIIKQLKEILQYIDTTKGMIRIHHGSIILENSSGLIHCRYFGWKNGMLLLCDNKKHPNFYFVSENDTQGLSFCGSMNLCLINNYGEFAHLPWYCLDSSIYPFIVKEVISPPEGCSINRFKSCSNRLVPSGYSIYNYSSSDMSVISNIEECLYKYGSVIKSRKANGTYCAKTLLLKKAQSIQENIKKQGFYQCLLSLEKDCINTTDVVSVMLEIWYMSKYMISFDRGFIDEVGEVGLVENNQLLINRDKILNALVYSANLCSKRINENEESFSDILLCDNRPFGKLANRIFNLSVKAFNSVFHDLFYNNKASLPNLINYYKIYNTELFNSILLKRKLDTTQVVKGSIFDFEDFTSLKSRMA